jgi:hypothetical protein
MSRKRRFYASLGRCPCEVVDRLEAVATADPQKVPNRGSARIFEGVADVLEGRERPAAPQTVPPLTRISDPHKGVSDNRGSATPKGGSSRIFEPRERVCWVMGEVAEGGDGSGGRQGGRRR